MCLRIYQEKQGLLYWERHKSDWIIPERREAFPGNAAAIVTRESGQDGLTEASFGIVPKVNPDSPWARKKLHNAKCETVFSLRTFKDSARESRCIVPVTAFFEQGDKRWLRYSEINGEPFLIAGIYAHPHGGNPSPAFSLLTCDSNQLILPINERMPLILSKEGMENWLNPDSTPEELTQLFGSCPSESFVVTDGGSMLREPKPKAMPDEQASKQPELLFED